MVILDPTAFSRFRANFFALGQNSKIHKNRNRICAPQRWLFDHYSSRIDVRRGGRRILYDCLRLDGDDGAVARRMGRFNVCLLAVMIGPLAQLAAARTVARVGDLPVDRRSDLLLSAAPLGGDGAVLRMAGTGVEQVGTALREHLRFLVPLLGDDPWLRKW